MHPLEIYLEELGAHRGVATKETSGYGALANLLNAVGHTLKPKVRCIIHPKNSGAGLPDGGLFTPDQFKNTDEDESFLARNPRAASSKSKPPAMKLPTSPTPNRSTIISNITDWCLLTNYREFSAPETRRQRQTHPLESFQLAPDEKSFWIVAAQPRKAANELGERFARISQARAAPRRAVEQSQGRGLLPRLVCARRPRARGSRQGFARARRRPHARWKKRSA